VCVEKCVLEGVLLAFLIFDNLQKQKLSWMPVFFIHSQHPVNHM